MHPAEQGLRDKKMSRFFCSLSNVRHLFNKEKNCVSCWATVSVPMGLSLFWRNEIERLGTRLVMDKSFNQEPVRRLRDGELTSGKGCRLRSSFCVFLRVFLKETFSPFSSTYLCQMRTNYMSDDAALPLFMMVTFFPNNIGRLGRNWGLKSFVITSYELFQR